MLQIVIVEDEQPAIDNLLYELQCITAQYKVVAILRSVEESIDWFKGDPPEIDLIFMDVQLTDGESFAIFKSVAINTPVIFTTAFDKYLLDSLECNGINYLLKPVNREKLGQSLAKFETFKEHFTHKSRQATHYLPEKNGTAKDRIIVKKGIEFQSMRAEHVAYFYTEHKLVFLVDKEGRKFMAHASNLTDLMEHLNKKIFYRANRKYIININFIKKYRPFDRVKVEVELSVQSPECVVISQENSGSFKNWIENL